MKLIKNTSGRNEKRQYTLTGLKKEAWRLPDGTGEKKTAPQPGMPYQVPAKRRMRKPLCRPRPQSERRRIRIIRLRSILLLFIPQFAPSLVHCLRGFVVPDRSLRAGPCVYVLRYFAVVLLAPLEARVHYPGEAPARVRAAGRRPAVSSFFVF